MGVNRSTVYRNGSEFLLNLIYGFIRGRFGGKLQLSRSPQQLYV